MSIFARISAFFSRLFGGAPAALPAENTPSHASIQQEASGATLNETEVQNDTVKPVSGVGEAPVTMPDEEPAYVDDERTTATSPSEDDIDQMSSLDTPQTVKSEADATPVTAKAPKQVSEEKRRRKQERKQKKARKRRTRKHGKASVKPVEPQVEHENLPHDDHEGPSASHTEHADGTPNAQDDATIEQPDTEKTPDLSKVIESEDGVETPITETTLIADRTADAPTADKAASDEPSSEEPATEEQATEELQLKNLLPQHLPPKTLRLPKSQPPKTLLMKTPTPLTSQRRRRRSPKISTSPTNPRPTRQSPK